MQFFRLLWPFVIPIFLAGCDGQTRDFDITQYEKATVVRSSLLGKDKDEIIIKTADGFNVTVTFLSRTSVFIAFQGESSRSKIYGSNWIQSYEIRQLNPQNLLMIKVTEARLTRLNEWMREEGIIVYDLSTRKVISSPTRTGGNSL